MNFFILSFDRNNFEFKNYTGSFIGIISKMIASSILYPFNLIRSRQQQLNKEFFEKINNNLLSNEKSKIANNDFKKETEFYRFKTIYTNLKYGNFINTTKTIYSISGYKGFYRGLTPLLIRQIPGSSVFFYTYESSLKILNNYFI